MLELRPTVFRAVFAGHEFYLEDRSPSGWAVCREGTCLNKETLRFNWEPQSRTDEWKAAHRFPTLENAAEFVEENAGQIDW